ncbi:MAG: MFS transporter [Ruegeria sp.]
MAIMRSFVLARSPMAGLAMVGAAWGTFSGVVPDIQAQAGVSDGQLGTALMCSALGSMMAMFLSPRFFAAAARWTLPIGGMVMVLVLNLPAFATNLTTLAVIMACMGASIGMLDITSNIRVSAIESEHGASLMNISHAMFSFAFGGAALVTGILREAGYSVGQILPLLSLAALALWLLIFEGADRWPASETEASDSTASQAGGARFWPVVLLTALILFASFIGENSTEAWSALHIEATLGAEAGIGSYGPAALGLVMGLARFFGQAVADRVGERNLIVGSAVLGATGALALATASSVGVAIASVAIIATGMSLVVPSANTVLGRRIPAGLRAKALSRAWMIGMVGFFVGPAMMGYVAETFGLRVSFGVVACIVALIIPATIGLARMPKL